MAPSMRYPSNARSFFTDQETKTIPRGVVLWRGYFQSVRPAVNRLLINIDISTGAMYQPGKLIPLCLDFLGKKRDQPHALTVSLLPDRERLHLQNFLKGMKVTTPYRTHNPNGKRVVKRLTRKSAREQSFEVVDGEMTVMEFFLNQLNIRLRFPDSICVKVRAIFVLNPWCDLTPYTVARVRSHDPTGALRSSSRTARS